MVGADAVLHFSDAERIEVGFDGGRAVELPGRVEKRLDELRFGCAFRLVFIEEGLGVALVGGLVFSGQDDGLTG
jgi:hypothetical protein